MSESQRKILDMLAQGKIEVVEAERLLRAVGEGETRDGAAAVKGKTPKYLHVRIESRGGEGGGDRVNVRVPFQMIRAGVRLASIMPAAAKDKVNEALDAKGIHLDLDRIKPEDLDELVKAMEDMVIDVDEGREKVSVYCE